MRYFLDQDHYGDWWIVPVDKRMEWDEWDCACEESSELLPVPEFAIAARQGPRWVEFETFVVEE